MVVFGISGCIRARWLYSGNLVVFCKSGGIWAKVVVFGEKWLHRAKWLNSGKTCCIRTKMVVFG